MDGCVLETIFKKLRPSTKNSPDRTLDRFPVDPARGLFVKWPEYVELGWHQPASENQPPQRSHAPSTQPKGRATSKPIRIPRTSKRTVNRVIPFCLADIPEILQRNLVNNVLRYRGNRLLTRECNIMHQYAHIFYGHPGQVLLGIRSIPIELQ